MMAIIPRWGTYYRMLYNGSSLPCDTQKEWNLRYEIKCLIFKVAVVTTVMPGWGRTIEYPYVLGVLLRAIGMIRAAER